MNVTYSLRKLPTELDNGFIYLVIEQFLLLFDSWRPYRLEMTRQVTDRNQ